MKILKPPGQKSACFKGQIGPGRSKPIWEVLYGVIGAYILVHIYLPHQFICTAKCTFFILFSLDIPNLVFSALSLLFLLFSALLSNLVITPSAKPRDSHVVNCNYHMNDHAVNSQCPSLSYIHLYPMYFYFVIDTTDWWVCWRKHLYLLHGELLEILIGMADLQKVLFALWYVVHEQKMLLSPS